MIRSAKEIIKDREYVAVTSRAALRFFIEEDAKANGIKPGLSYYVKLFYGNIPARAFRYLKSLRHYEYALNTNSPLLFWYRLKNRRIGAKYNVAIMPNTVGYGLKLPHLELGVIINCSSMGNHCIVNSGVVLGNKRPGENDQTPKVGNNVNFCVGSKAIGAITIGDNALIAPNAVVTKDVPANNIVAGIPAKIIKTLES